MRRAVVLLLSLAVFSVWGCSSLPRNYAELDSSAEMPLETMLSKLEGSRVVFVGEIHADRKSQRVQLEVMRHLNDSGRKVIAATELFPPDKQSVLDDWIKSRVARDDFKKEFESTMKMPFRYYEHIFELARGKKIPLIAINADPQLVEDVSKKGYKSVPVEIVDKYRFTDCSTDSGYADMLGSFQGKGYHDAELPHLCDAQRFRDTVMAYNIAALLEESEKTIVVFTGAVHSVKGAVPRLLQGYVPVTYTVIMPRKAQALFSDGMDAAMADYVWY